MIETSIIQEMQMCMLCSPGFDKKESVLSHKIGLHTFVYEDKSESCGNDKYINQQKAKHKENKI